MNTSRKNSRLSFSKESHGWLLAALDPYHDNQLDVEGLPDERSAPSVVQVHNQSYNMTVPTSAGSSNWNASILFTGVNTPINPTVSGGMVTVTGSGIHTYDSASLSVGSSFGALNLWAGAAGSVMSTGSPITTGDYYASLGSVLNTDRCRLIGAAFEIHNTTAEIYRQGSLTVAQLPDSASDASTVLYLDTNVSTPAKPHDIQSDRCLKQACTMPYLQAVPGSQTWPAADGVYAIPRMTQVPRDLVSYAYTPGVAANQGASGRVQILYGTDGKIATPEPVGLHTVSAGSIPLTKPMAPNGFSPLQVFLTGLSNQTTLTVTFRTIVEYFPALDSPLLPLASPSPCFDALVLGAYSEIVSVAPYAVPVDQNSAGEYFRKILRIVGQALTLTSPMFGQYAPLVATLGNLGMRFAVAKDEAGPRADPVRKRR